MPYARPTLKTLRSQVASDIASNLPGSDPLLRFSNLSILGEVQAGLSYLHYSFLDWVAKQSVPFTATDEYLEAWAAVRKIARKAATAATGTVTFTGTVGAALDAGQTLQAGDGTTFTTTSSSTVGADGTVTVSATAVEPGADGNVSSGIAMSLTAAVTGVNVSGTAATDFIGGADQETDDDFRDRVMAAFQQTPQGGARDDYEAWATAVSGVTRAWVMPNGAGAGTVVLYFMMDDAQAAHDGFPQGTDGVATGESRGVQATGDQLTVADAIYDEQPVTALVYACAPAADPVAFTISGLSTASTTLKSSISSAISDVFFRKGTATGGTVNLSDIESSIAALPGAAGFVIELPDGNITTDLGKLPTLGTITYT